MQLKGILTVEVLQSIIDTIGTFSQAGYELYGLLLCALMKPMVCSLPYHNCTALIFFNVFFTCMVTELAVEI